MPFEPKKYKEIFIEMRDKSQVVTDFEVGSIARTMYESFAFELALMYEKMRLVYLAGYVDTAQGRDLEQVVAILGIERGLPDFAEGIITFTRDSGQTDIDIPLGTLVATEDTPELPKKVYQTLQAQTLGGNQSSIEVKIRAFERGESQETERETISVMPRPIPGIKSVINTEPIRFTGKGTETDEALRERAKNTLISAGKATRISIENTLISMPGVKDVRIRERFYRARANIILTRGGGGITGQIPIPSGTRILITVPGVIGNDIIAYQTIFQAILLEGESSVSIEIEALKEGSSSEISDPSEIISWEIEGIDPGTLTVDSTSVPPLVQQGFGVIDIFVDGPDLDDADTFTSISQAVDQVKAAGIYPIITGVNKVHMMAIFRIDLPADLSLTPEEIIELETEVVKAIEDYIAELSMGTPLVFTKLITNILGLDQVENMDQFTIEIDKPHRPSLAFPTYELANRQIELEEDERIDLANSNIYVAAEDKQLPLDISFQGGNLTEDLDLELNTLQNIINNLPFAEPKSLDELETEIASAISSLTHGPSLDPISINVDTLQIQPRSIYNRAVIHEDSANPGNQLLLPSLVEQFVLGNLFAYEVSVEIVGALNVIFEAGFLQAEKDVATEGILTAIDEYIDAFGSEEPIPLAGIQAIAQEQAGVLSVEMDTADFRAFIGGEYRAEIIEKDQISILLKQKAGRSDILITDQVEEVSIAVTDLSVTLQIEETEVTPPPTFDQIRSQARQETLTTVNNFLSGIQAGEDVDVNNFITLVGGTSQGIDLTLDTFTLTATYPLSEDGGSARTQVVSQDNIEDIFIRSIERAVLQPIDPEELTINSSSTN